MDNHVKSIFLFGHGERHGIKIGKDEMIYYCEFLKTPKRNLIAQFHCNHLKGKSLADYGQKPIFTFIKNKVQYERDLDKQISEIIKSKVLEK